MAVGSQQYRIQFGSGFFYAYPVGNSGGAFTGQPVQLATLQDVDVTFDATIKELRGNLQFPDDTAISDKKITWKSGTGRFDIHAWNNMFFGDSVTSGNGGTNPGNGVPVDRELQAIPATPGPYTVTVDNAANYLSDLGVLYASTGQPLAPVASGPTQGEYSVNTSTGVYTFAAADQAVDVLISYRYKVATGNLVKIASHVQGWGPYFGMLLSEPYQELTAGVPNYLELYQCKCNKLTMPLKRADYLISDLEGEAYSNAAGFVGEAYTD